MGEKVFVVDTENRVDDKERSGIKNNSALVLINSDDDIAFKKALDVLRRKKLLKVTELHAPVGLDTY